MFSPKSPIKSDCSLDQISSAMDFKLMNLLDKNKNEITLSSNTIGNERKNLDKNKNNNKSENSNNKEENNLEGKKESSPPMDQLEISV